MKWWNSFLLFCGLVMLGICPVEAGHAKNLYRLYKNALADSVFRIPDTKELHDAQTIFNMLFNGLYTDRLMMLTEKHHFILERVSIGGKLYLIMREEESHKTGRGFYLFPSEPVSGRNALQMPHGVKDIHTGRIGIALFLEGDFNGAALNSVPRHYKQGAETVTADLADFSQSYFIAFSRSYALNFPEGYMIQLHGFSAGKRKTRAGSESVFIVSPGIRSRDHVLEKFDRCLENNYGVISGLYPLEVRELGGTQNRIGKVLREMGHKRFLHLEINRNMRNQMVKAQHLRGKLIKCIREMDQ